MQQQQQQSPRFWSVLLVLAASLACIFFYVIPFLSSVGVGESGGLGYSDEQKEAYQLAQEVQVYRKNHPSPGNYAQAAIRQTYDDGTVSKWNTSYIYEGFDDIDGENSTHSEQYAHQWVLNTIAIYKGRTSWARITALTIVFYSQVRVCRRCQIDMRSWRNAYQQAAGKPVAVTIWEHARFFIKTPRTGAVFSEDDVVPVTIK